ncbi:MAG TPA: heme-binding domain-containing protein [Saprospiraceae bacterium]|nr:heme-binding domain-containing protein [Saprospiraceae bacterium]HMQ83937.1 heme-binding domain-containing protein [Saprospiraceae bacterium]
MKSLVKKIGLGLLAVLVIIQFIRIDKTNPAVEPGKDFLAAAGVPAETGQLIKAACYDCHSHHTIYPWYTNVAPVSWWIKKHINEGRKHLNFSTWADYDAKKKDHKLEECVEEVKEGHMPIASYTWMHPEAKLSQQQKEQLVAWFDAYRRNAPHETPSVPIDRPASSEEEEEDEDGK